MTEVIVKPSTKRLERLLRDAYKYNSSARQKRSRRSETARVPRVLAHIMLVLEEYPFNTAERDRFGTIAHRMLSEKSDEVRFNWHYCTLRSYMKPYGAHKCICTQSTAFVAPQSKHCSSSGCNQHSPPHRIIERHMNRVPILSATNTAVAVHSPTPSRKPPQSAAAKHDGVERKRSPLGLRSASYEDLEAEFNNEEQRAHAKSPSRSRGRKKETAGDGGGTIGDGRPADCFTGALALLMSYGAGVDDEPSPDEARKLIASMYTNVDSK